MGGSCIRFQNKPPPSLSLKYKKSCSYLSFSFQHTRSLFYFRIIILCRHSFFVQKQVWITRFKHVPHTHTTRANTDWHTDRSTITRKSNDISKESLSKRKSWISHREKKKEEKKKGNNFKQLITRPWEFRCVFPLYSFSFDSVGG